jgi:hypothetical protein
MRRSVEYLKPPRFRNYFTLQELCDFVGKQPKWIRTLEKDGRIPTAMRVKRGKVEVRLWSPAQADEIAMILSRHRPGRPPSNE